MERLEENKYKIPYLNNSVIVERKDPYGFYFAHLEKGTIPKELEGSFTDLNVIKGIVDNLIHIKTKDK